MISKKKNYKHKINWGVERDGFGSSHRLFVGGHAKHTVILLKAQHLNYEEAQHTAILLQSIHTYCWLIKYVYNKHTLKGFAAVALCITCIPPLRHLLTPFVVPAFATRAGRNVARFLPRVSFFFVLFYFLFF